MASTVAESRPPDSRTTARFTGTLAALCRETRACLARRLRAREARDDVLEGIAGASGVALLRLDRRDREQRVGRLGRLRILRDQLFLRRERVAVVAHVGVADADPVARIRRERARRIVLHERAERIDRGGEVVAAKEVRGGVVRLHLAGLVVAARNARGRARRAALHRRGRAGGARGRAALEALEARVEVEVEVALALLDLLVLVGEHLELPAQARDLGVHALELAHQLDDPDAADRLLEALDARLVVLALLRQVLLQQLDAPARLVVVEEAGVGGSGGRQREHAGGAQPAGRGARSPIHPRTLC